MEVSEQDINPRLSKIEEPAPNIRYIGRADSLRGSDSEEIWQILRQHRVGDTIVSTYALMGSYTAKWSERASYFTPVAPNSSFPLDSNVTVTGGVSQSGLNIGGRITEVELVDTEWRPLPAIPLEDRNSIQIQNFSGKDIKINYTSDHASSFGVFIRDSTERMYMIKDTIIVYGRSSRGVAKIIVEEIA